MWEQQFTAMLARLQAMTAADLRQWEYRANDRPSQAEFNTDLDAFREEYELGGRRLSDAPMQYADSHATRDE
jgi:hypothetical protein